MMTVTFDETQWKLVPVEPSIAMCIHGAGKIVGHDGHAMAEIYRAMVHAAPAAPLSADAAQEQADSSHVLPPTRGTESQQFADQQVMAELRRWAGDDPGYAAMLIRRAVKEIEEIESELARRCRAQGGATQAKSSGDALIQAREQALEEAAKVCDEVASRYDHGDAAAIHSRACAKFIRALRTPAAGAEGAA